MPKISDVYAGDYISAAQLPDGRRVPAFISAAVAEEVGQDKATKVVLTLKAHDGRLWPRGLVLNKTNALMLVSAYGDDTSAWIGRPIEVWKEPVQFQGKIVPGIKIAPGQQPPPAAAGAIPLGPPSGGNASGATMQTGPDSSVLIPQTAPSATGPVWAGPGGDLDDEIPF
jgi:hypothetical protein